MKTYALAMLMILPSLTFAAERAPHPLAEARRLVIAQDFAGAIAAFEIVRDEQPEAITPLDGDQFGAVYAAAADLDGMLESARWMFKRFPLPQRVEDAERTAKTYLIYPDTDDATLAAHALELTTFAAENGKGQWVNWFYTAHALALYRNGRFQEASDWAEKSIDDEDPSLASFALPIQAMAQHALGNSAEAEALLKRSRERVSVLPEPGTAEYAKEWSNILTSQAVLAEAERVIR